VSALPVAPRDPRLHDARWVGLATRCPVATDRSRVVIERGAPPLLPVSGVRPAGLAGRTFANGQELWEHIKAMQARLVTGKLSPLEDKVCIGNDGWRAARCPADGGRSRKRSSQTGAAVRYRAEIVVSMFSMQLPLGHVLPMEVRCYIRLFPRLARNARCSTTSHLTADAVVSYMSREKRLV
jgi:hypothetical protein